MQETFIERQRRENQRQYEKWLSCGFQGEMELDKNGWCTNGISFYKSENVERCILFDNPYFKGTIEVMELPNGKWISGSSCTFPLHGWGHGVSVWNEQYDTKQEAIFNQIDYIERNLSEKDKKKFVLDALQSCRNKYKEIDVELAFEPQARFEEVSLF